MPIAYTSTVKAGLLFTMTGGDLTCRRLTTGIHNCIYSLSHPGWVSRVKEFESSCSLKCGIVRAYDTLLFAFLSTIKLLCQLAIKNKR